MKIILCAIIALLIHQLPLFSQGGEYIDCHLLPSGSSLNLQGQSTCYDYYTEYEDAPIITLYVNVHIFNTTPAVSNATLIQRARDFIRFSNETFANMQQNWRDGPGGVPAPYIPDAKIRVKLYSESSNPNDLNGGIWTYSTQMYDIFDATEEHPQYLIGDVPYTPRYGNKVIDVILVNYGLFSKNGENNLVSLAGVTQQGATNSNNYIYVSDVNAAAERDIIENNGTNNWLKAISRTFNHEVGHVFNLYHSEYCFNPCDDIDIDVEAECGAKCPQVATCNGYNPEDINCNGNTVSTCTWGNSRNIVSQGWWNDAITPCQWEQVFMHALNNSRNFYRLCSTNTTLNLTSSPLDDYRASQSITSTSIVTGTRKVDYFSPLIRLNAGFRVAQGTQFWAYPASFACCSSGSLQSNEDISYRMLELDSKADNSNIYPNPFKDELHLNTELLGLQDLKEPYSVSIFDNQGRQVYKGKISSIDNVKLDTSNWKSGFYFIVIQSATESLSKKVIKI